MNFYHSIRYCVWIYQQQRINLTENSMLCYGPLVSELGGGRVHGAPNPVIGGPVPPPGSDAYAASRQVDAKTVYRNLCRQTCIPSDHINNAGRVVG